MRESTQNLSAYSQQNWLYLLVFLGYSVIAILCFRSLLLNFGDVVPGGLRTDYDHFIWNYWWMDYALTNGLDPLQSDYMLFPNTHNLTLHTLTPIWLPLWIIAEPVLGRIGFFTIAIVLSTTLTGLATFAWLKPMIKRTNFALMVAFGAGVFFAFQPYVRFSASNSHLNIISLWWIPLTLVLWREVVFRRVMGRVVASILLGLAFWGVWLTDYALWLSLPIILGGYGGWTLWYFRYRWRWLPLVLFGIFALMIMGAGMLIYPSLAFFTVDTGNPYVYPPSSLETIRELALSPLAWIGLDFDPENRRVGSVLAVLFWGSLITLLFTRWRGRVVIKAQAEPAEYPSPPLAMWVLLALPFALLMLGADVQIGETRLTLPYRRLHEILNGQYRTPERFVLPLTFVVVTFISMTADRLITPQFIRARRWIAVVPLLFGGVMLLETGILDSFPTRTIIDYPVYDAIGEDDREYTILDVPVGVHYGWTGMGAGRYSIIYTPLHQKRTVNGFLARIPFSDYAYYTDSPFFTWLAQNYPRNDEQIARINASFADYLEGYPIGYVFAHRQWMTDAQMTDWIGWLNMRDGLCMPQMSDDTLLIWWRAETLGCEVEVPSATTINIGASDWLYIGEGWYAPENVGGPMARWAGEQVTLRVELPPGERIDITLMATAFNQSRIVTIAGQTITVTPDGWHTYTITVPADALVNDRLQLTHDSTETALSLGLSTDERPLSVAYASITLTISE